MRHELEVLMQVVPEVIRSISTEGWSAWWAKRDEPYWPLLVKQIKVPRHDSPPTAAPRRRR